MDPVLSRSLASALERRRARARWLRCSAVLVCGLLSACLTSAPLQTAAWQPPEPAPDPQRRLPVPTAPEVARPDAAALFAPAWVSGYLLSPDGQQLSYVQAQADTDVVWRALLDARGRVTRSMPVWTLPAGSRVGSAAWKDDRRLIVTTRRPAEPAEVFVVPMGADQPPRPGQPLAQPLRLSQPGGTEALLALAPGDAQHLLLSRRLPSGVSEAHRVHLGSGRRTLAHRSTERGHTRWWADEQGHIRVVRLQPEDRGKAAVWWHRPQASAALQPLAEAKTAGWRHIEALRLDPSAQRMLAVRRSAVADELLMVDLNSGELTVRHVVDRRKPGSPRLSAVWQAPTQAEPMALELKGWRSDLASLDPAVQRIWLSLRTRLSGQDIRVLDISANGQRWLVSARNDRQAEQVHVFDVNAATLAELPGTQRVAEPAALLPLAPVEWTARDGSPRAGLFGRSPRREDAAKAPVLFAAVDQAPLWRFQPWTQWLAAAQGHPVLWSDLPARAESESFWTDALAVFARMNLPARDDACIVLAVPSAAVLPAATLAGALAAVDCVAVVVGLETEHSVAQGLSAWRHRHAASEGPGGPEPSHVANPDDDRLSRGLPSLLPVDGRWKNKRVAVFIAASADPAAAPAWQQRIVSWCEDLPEMSVLRSRWSAGRHGSPVDPALLQSVADFIAERSAASPGPTPVGLPMLPLIGGGELSVKRTDPARQACSDMSPMGASPRLAALR